MPEEDLLEETPCPNCGKGPFVRDEESGELVCANCGYVLLEKQEDEGRSFPTSGGRTGTSAGPGTSVARPDMGLSTTIGRGDKDAAGRALPGRGRSTLEKIRLWDKRSQPNVRGARGMARAFDQMRAVAARLSLGGSVVEQGAYIYRKALTRGLTRGRSTASLAAACLYAACREKKIPRSLKEVASASNVKMKELTRAYRVLVNVLDITMPVEDPLMSLSKVGSAMGASPNVMRRARMLLEAARASDISAGKDPASQAGAALYLASRLEGANATQKGVADAAGVTELTLRNRYHTLRTGLRLE